MFQKEWPVLLVDDDPDVLAISKLAMKSFDVDGVPIRLFTATSKEEAIELLNSSLGGAVFPYISVAFVDVVMESDQAGLELCKHIRETMGNKLTQIYIRTGQPGVAPEREVIDRYDINGYFSKVETTEDKLYSLVKAGVRQFEFTSMALLEFDVVTQAIAASDSLEHLQRVMFDVLGRVPLNPQGEASHPESFEPRVSMLLGDRLLAGTIPEDEAIAERDRLVEIGLQPLNENGDAVGKDGHSYLLKVAATDTHDEAWHLGYFPGRPTLPDLLVVNNFTKAIATLARQAARSAQPAGAV